MAETEVMPVPKNRTKDVHIFFDDRELNLLEERMKDLGVRNRSAFILKWQLTGIVSGWICLNFVR